MNENNYIFFCALFVMYPWTLLKRSAQRDIHIRSVVHFAVQNIPERVKREDNREINDKKDEDLGYNF